MTTRLRQHGRTVRSYGPDHPIARAIAERQPFLAGSLSGTGDWSSSGRLSDADLTWWRADRDQADYFVVSYSTPIAWHVPASSRGVERWVSIVSRFSHTTTRHQSYVRMAVT